MRRATTSGVEQIVADEYGCVAGQQGLLADEALHGCRVRHAGEWLSRLGAVNMLHAACLREQDVLRGRDRRAALATERLSVGHQPLFSLAQRGRRMGGELDLELPLAFGDRSSQSCIRLTSTRAILDARTGVGSSEPLGDAIESMLNVAEVQDARHTSRST